MSAAAALIDGAARNDLAALTFGGAAAGRAHVERGEALRVELERLTAQVRRWSRTADEIAIALRAGADRYAGADMYAAARIA